MAIKRTCYNCDGDGELEIYDHVTGETEIVECSVCEGSGKLFWGTVEELSDIMDKINDVLNKCNDILELLEKK